MPIEILELLVRAKVEAPGREPEADRAAAPAPAGAPHTSPQVDALEKAVREVLDILKRKNER